MIEIRTKFDENVAKELNKQAMKKLWWVYAFFTIILIGAGLLILLGGEEIDYSGIIYICVGVLFFPLCLLLTKFAQKKVNKSMSILSNENIEIYKFDSDKIIIEQTKGTDFHGLTEANYSYLHKVVETEKFWFLYISVQQSHVVPKNMILTGSIEELNNIFKEKLGTKFKPFLYPKK